MTSFKIDNLNSQVPKIKYATAKKAITLAKTKPQQMYPFLDTWIKLLNGENQILVWNALQVIGNLVQIDQTGKIDPLIKPIIKLLNSSKLVTASNAAFCLIEIAKYKPKYRKLIFEELIKVEKYKYRTPECTNVVIQNVLIGMSSIPNLIKEYPFVTKFLKRQLMNSRAKVNQSARELLGKVQVIK